MPKQQTAARRNRTAKPGVVGNEWQLQHAKARFSEVFRLARSRGPQRITKHAREAVVVIPAEQFERLTGRARQPRSLAEFFAKSPLAGSGIRLDRAADYGRPVEL